MAVPTTRIVILLYGMNRPEKNARLADHLWSNRSAAKKNAPTKNAPARRKNRQQNSLRNETPPAKAGILKFEADKQLPLFPD